MSCSAYFLLHVLYVKTVEISHLCKRGKYICCRKIFSFVPVLPMLMLVQAGASIRFDGYKPPVFSPLPMESPLAFIHSSFHFALLPFKKMKIAVFICIISACWGLNWTQVLPLILSPHAPSSRTPPSFLLSLLLSHCHPLQVNPVYPAYITGIVSNGDIYVMANIDTLGVRVIL